MKMKMMTKTTVGLSALIIAMVAGCEMSVTPAGTTVAVAPPVVDVGVAVSPDYYAWDGVEYVGVVGGTYYYLNGGAWVVCDPVVLGRFHGWERGHPDWHRHAIRNDPHHRIENRGRAERHEERR